MFIYFQFSRTRHMITKNNREIKLILARTPIFFFIINHTFKIDKDKKTIRVKSNQNT